MALAAALAVRAPRLGHVFVDLATIRDTATVDADEPVDLAALPWPEPADWVARVGREPRSVGGRGRCGSRAARSTSTATGARSARLAADLRALDGAPPSTSRARRRRWPGCFGDGRQPAARRRGRRCAAGSRSSPAARAPARRRPSRGSSRCCSSRRARRRSIALAAPTGKAAARLRRRCTRGASVDVAPAIASGCSSSTPRRCTACSAGGPDSAQPLPPRPRQPAPARRRDRRRDVDGVAVADGAAGRGRAAGRAAGPRRRPRPAHLDRGGRRARRHRRGRRRRRSSCSTRSTASARASPRSPRRSARGDGDAHRARPRSPASRGSDGRRDSCASARCADRPRDGRPPPPRRATARARSPRSASFRAAVRAPPRPVRRERVDRADRGLDRRGRRRVVRRPPAARDRERLRAAALQRRHRRGRRRPTAGPDRRVRAPCERQPARGSPPSRPSTR